MSGIWGYNWGYFLSPRSVMMVCFLQVITKSQRRHKISRNLAARCHVVHAPAGRISNFKLRDAV
jgi:hypothetical protein